MFSLASGTLASSRALGLALLTGLLAIAVIATDLLALATLLASLLTLTTVLTRLGLVTAVALGTLGIFGLGGGCLRWGGCTHRNHGSKRTKTTGIK
ncbi:hypothetical protein ACXYL9_10840 [Qipengyuania sp. CAU 1752]